MYAESHSATTQEKGRPCGEKLRALQKTTSDRGPRMQRGGYGRTKSYLALLRGERHRLATGFFVSESYGSLALREPGCAALGRDCR